MNLSHPAEPFNFKGRQFAQMCGIIACIKIPVAFCLHTSGKCVVILLLAQVNFGYVPPHVLILHMFNLVSWSYDSLSNIWLYHTDRGDLGTVYNPRLKDYEGEKICEPMLSLYHRSCYSFFSLSWHLWTGFFLAQIPRKGCAKGVCAPQAANYKHAVTIQISPVHWLWLWLRTLSARQKRCIRNPPSYAVTESAGDE